MKKKILSLILLSVLSASLIAGCSTNNGEPAGDTEEKAAQTEQTQKPEEPAAEKKSNKGKYENIDADSVPIGVDEVKFINSKTSEGNTYVHITGRVYKNGGDIEESYVSVVFELYDEAGTRIGKKTISPSESLKEGDDAHFDEDLIVSCDRSEYLNIPEDSVAAYTAKIIEIKEEDAEEAALEEIISEISSEINWYQEYDKAQIMLDAALEKYPDNTDLKLLQAELDAAKAKAAGEQK